MFIHHTATVVLLIMSYITNHIRIGCLIILVHDSADYWLEVGCLLSQRVSELKQFILDRIAH